MKKQVLFAALIPLTLTVAACSTYQVPRYSSSPNIAISLRNLHKQYPNASFDVGNFADTAGKIGNCRLAGPVVAPDGKTYNEYIGDSLADELKLASMYDKTGTLISGDVEKIDFDTNSGTWLITARVNISGQKPVDINERYDYRTSFAGGAACEETSQAFEPAVQDLISKLIASPQFRAALKSSSLQSGDSH